VDEKNRERARERESEKEKERERQSERERERARESERERERVRESKRPRLIDFNGHRKEGKGGCCVEQRQGGGNDTFKQWHVELERMGETKALSAP